METFAERYLPVLSTRNAVIFPGTSLPLKVGRPKTVAAVEKAREIDQWIITIAQKTDRGTELAPSDLYTTGTLCKIEKIQGDAENGYQAIVRGVSRFKIHFARDTGTLIEARGEILKDGFDVDQKTLEALVTSLKTSARDILALVPGETEQLVELVDGITDIAYLMNLSAANLDVPVSVKQELLELVSVKDRALRLLDIMQAFKESLEVQSEIREKLSHKMGKAQREAFLRAQMHAIREELGEEDDEAKSNDYRKKIADAGMPDDIRKVALEELKRLEAMGNNSAESHVIQNYLDLLVALPWSKSAPNNPELIDLQSARATLDADHYGLDKVKKRIVQHLGVMKLKKDARGSILLFVGPPGVGKTSLGRSIAKVLGRKFVRVSLGGVRDDAEIRGHRRTYIGAMPGRIVQGIKRAGENNPVMMLDEIDKMARSFQGDPASAMLEVLDPEQNVNFLDHYLDVAFDLSKVTFIATANTLETIPGPLLDRMEIIDLTGYTSAEKLHIGKNHLVRKQLDEHGLTPEQLAFSDEGLMRIITHYTREAGVRELQRVIAAVCRASTEKVLAPEATLPVKVDIALLEDILGPEKYVHEVAERITPPGVVTGLAWTPVGGEILFIEASLMPGTGKLTLTGQLGDVMKESAQIALSLVRSKLPTIIPGFDYDKKDIHVHVPAGGIPKDGPSAGITMLTTIASLFLGRAVNPKIAMTGELTLRGAVMPVGGIKEKVLAAHRAGIERVIMSKRNQKDLRDVPEEVKSQLRFDFVETVGEVLKITLGLEIAKAHAAPSVPPSEPTPAVA